MLKYCKNVKELYVNACSEDAERNWLLYTYPKLEHLHLVPGSNGSYCIDELNAFFIQNPNIRKFSTSVAVLWNNRDILLNSKVKLDLFEVKEDFPDMWIKYKKAEVCEDLLNRLYE